MACPGARPKHGVAPAKPTAGQAVLPSSNHFGRLNSFGCSTAFRESLHGSGWQKIVFKKGS